MSKKHFTTLARTLKTQREAIAASRGKARATILATHDEMIRDIAALCASKNPHFDYERFYTACGMRDGN